MNLQRCSHVMLSFSDKDHYRHIILNPNLGYLTRKALRKRIWEKAKKTTTCQNCGGLNGPVKKDGFLKIVHEKYKNKKKSDPIVKRKLDEFCNAIEHNNELEGMAESALIENLTPIVVRLLYNSEVSTYSLCIILFKPSF